MVLGDETLEGELVAELGSEPSVAHHGLLPPFRRRAARMDHITEQIPPRVRQHPRQTTYRSLPAAKPGEAAQTYLAGASELMV
jgi:hypothetical protein